MTKTYVTTVNCYMLQKKNLLGRALKLLLGKDMINIKYLLRTVI